jgi:two-component system, cell cycle sensor histidine kinase and response regulator CckA
MAVAATESILIVEDDEGVGFLQSRALERHGFRVTLVDSAEAALVALGKHTFDLAILDYLLPGIKTGLDLYSQMKDAGQLVPVIFVTGFSDQDTVIKALRAGASDFITKSTEYLDYLPEAAERVLRQRRLERELADTQARFQSFIDNGPAVILFKDAEGRVTYVNRQYERLFPGLDWHGKTEEEVLPGKRTADVHDANQTADAEGCFTQRIEGMKMPDGRLRHWLSYHFPIRGTGDACLTGVVAIDVTARTQAEQALRDSEAKFRSVTDSATDAVVAVDADLKIVSWNKGARQIFGYDQQEVLGQALDHLLARLEPLHNGLDIFQVNHARPLQEQIEFVGRRRDGTEFPLELSVGHWQTGHQTFFSVIIRDITERKRSEEALRQSDLQLRQSQKMEAIGTLAGGVAHEFNNLLQAIQGYTLYAINGLPEDDERRHDLQQVLKASERATTLTRQLLGFSRREVLRLADLDPNEQVRDLVKLLRPLIGADIEVEMNLAPDIGMVHADAGHLQQLLMNLCVNARDAMPQGGKLLIKTENLLLTNNLSELRRDLEPGRYLVLSVTDNGCGMTSEVRDRIFEPFFTTKGVGKGTGLGLPMVYGVVRQHNGTVRVYSEVGMGTSFRIYLPAIDQTSPQRLDIPRSKPRGGSETILVAEDDPMVRDVAVRILERAGYRTIIAADGIEAVELFEQHMEDISLAVVDVVMPRLSGREVYQKIKEIKPETQVVFCSGYDPEMTDANALPGSTAQVVQKPFDPEKLLDIIRDTLDNELCLTD